MSKKLVPRRFSRREVLKLGVRGVLGVAATGGALATWARYHQSQAAPGWPGEPPEPVILPPGRPNAATTNLRLAATDGFISLPGRRIFPNPASVSDPFDLPDGQDGVYVFGFRRVPLSVTPSGITNDIGAAILSIKGHVQGPSPILEVRELDQVNITLTNLGFEMRPDLDDSHTIHWHGFRNPNAVFDGVPEVSISVPPGRDFTYFYLPRTPGSFPYHCHFEDTEHVQMGMDGVVIVTPDYPVPAGFSGVTFASDDTAFHRHYTLLLNEVDTTPHDSLINIQEFIWSNYDANYWVINARSYPDTLLTDDDIVGTELEQRQPVSSLIQALGGEQILLRFVNIGYEQQAMQLLGIRMKVIGQDATPLVVTPTHPNDLSYETSTIYIGPGESRDALFTAPAFTTSLPVETDGDGRNYNVYWLKNHNFQRLVNGNTDRVGDPRFSGNFTDVDPEDIFGNPAPLGGQITHVRVYEPGALGPQTKANETFGSS